MIITKLKDWTMSYEAHKELSCKVPCSMYSVLLEHKLIDDPFYRDNEYALTDYSRKDCEFDSTFEVTGEMLSYNNLILKFDGIDTVADIYVNGQKVYYADNMHYAHEIDIKPYVSQGQNTVKVHIYSPLTYMEEKQRRHPIWGQRDTMEGFPHIRKSSCMMGWDWAPKLPDMGLYRDVEVLCYNARILDVYATQKHSENKVVLDIQAEIYGKYDKCVVTLTSPNGKKFDCVLNDGKGQITIEDPMLWWPNNLGEQHLYSLQTQLYCEDKVCDTNQKSIGLRTLTVSTAADCWGHEFCFVVNGVKVFAMGADYIPEDSLISRLCTERTENLIKSCAEANHNAIRVWGGAFYPNEYFYDACDKYGIIVWQDFMFACESVRISPWFLDTMKKELTYNIKRLRNRACLGLFSGNNEMEYEHVCQNKTKTELADYLEFFEHYVSDVCDELAPQVFYWPSSPSAGGGFRDCNTDNHGDQHYWGAWHGSIPFESYREHYFRFCSEFGFESYPNMKTIATYTTQNDLNPLSPVMEAHQKCRTGIQRLLSYMSDKYMYPTTLKGFVYATQILQADAIRYGVEHFRRYRGRCMGAVYWQLNDCWPVASWASVDYYGRWKALHYSSKRFFAPVLLSLHENGTNVTVNISNETHNAFNGTVKYGIRDMNLNTLFETSSNFTVDKFSANDISTKDYSDIVTGKEKETFMFCEMYDDNGTLVSSCSVLFVKPKQLKLEKPIYKVKVSGQNGKYTALISSNAYSKFTELDFDSIDAKFSDNYFDIVSGNDVAVEFTTQDTSLLASDLEKDLRIFSLYDIK